MGYLNSDFVDAHATMVEHYVLEGGMDESNVDGDIDNMFEMEPAHDFDGELFNKANPHWERGQDEVQDSSLMDAEAAALDFFTLSGYAAGLVMALFVALIVRSRVKSNMLVGTVTTPSGQRQEKNFNAVYKPPADDNDDDDDESLQTVDADRGKEKKKQELAAARGSFVPSLSSSSKSAVVGSTGRDSNRDMAAAQETIMAGLDSFSDNVVSFFGGGTYRLGCDAI
jgi:hypothetical protein